MNETQRTEQQNESHDIDEDSRLQAAAVSFVEQVEIALTAAKQQRKLLMVLCDKAGALNLEIWNHAQVIDAIKRSAICLLIRENTLSYTQFTTLYPVTSLPAVYCIDPTNGQVLECLIEPQQITVDAVLDGIQKSVTKLHENQQPTQQQLQQQPQQQDLIQINELHGNDSGDDEEKQDTNQQLLAIREMDPRSEDSIFSVSTEKPLLAEPQVKSSISKLQQIREKAKSQKKIGSKSSKNVSENLEVTSSSTMKSKSDPKSSNVPATTQKATTAAAAMNNYNSKPVSASLDALECMEVTRRNKLRKRKKTTQSLQNTPILPKKVPSSSSNTSGTGPGPAEAMWNTPIATHQTASSNDALRSSRNTAMENFQLNEKKTRLAFRINNELDLQRHFSYNNRLSDVMRFVTDETGLTHFTLISQYPPLNVDSLYMHSKMSEADSGEVKSNESHYDAIQTTLQKTLFELNLVPSSRIFIQPNFKEKAVENGQQNVVAKLCNAIWVALCFGYDRIAVLLLWLFALLWSLVKMPLEWIGIGDSTRNVERQKQQSRTNQKLPKHARDRKTKIMRLSHFEDESDQNTLNNGNSTMYGGDDKGK